MKEKKKKRESGPTPNMLNHLVAPYNPHDPYNGHILKLPTHKRIIYIGSEGTVGSTGPVLVLFLFYVNVSGMCLQFRLSSQPLMIPASWILLCIKWSISMVPPWVTASRFLMGNEAAKLKPLTFSHLLIFLAPPTTSLLLIHAPTNLTLQCTTW